VIIHRRDCPNALRWQDENNERLIEVEWSHHDGERTSNYPVDIHIDAFDRVGLLRDICTIVTDENLNILATNTSTNQPDNSVQMMFSLEANNLDQLSRALGKIDNLANVMNVWRKNG